MSPYRIVFGKACHLLDTKLSGQLSNATWPMTKQGSKENSSYKNWTNSAWKLVRTLKSIGKLRSRWDRPFVIINVFSYGVVELKDERTKSTFQVNEHQIKLFHEGPTPIVGDIETISLMEPGLPDDTP
ncbi:hypothetical protein CR513_40254, partial [Mucuna pruriens]